MLFVDASTNKVGINTAIPEATLDVKTDLAITEAAAANSTSTLSLYSKFSDSQRGFVILKAESLASGSSDLVINARNAFTDAERLRIASSGDVTFTGNLVIPSQIIHAGDTDTYMQFHAADSWRVVTANSERFHIQEASVVFNHDGHDADFRIESDNDANALFIEGGNGEVTFGKNTISASTVGVGIRGTTGETFCSISTGNTLHVYDTVTPAFRFYVNVNGGISNYSANNVNLSDEREKKNVEALPSQWDCLKHWDLKQFHYNADDDALPKKYGVIAQEIEAHCPEVIDVFKVDEDIERMGVKEQQMMWMAIKALQEAQTRIESLEARIAALES
jgi:hypothetical protein